MDVLSVAIVYVPKYFVNCHLLGHCDQSVYQYVSLHINCTDNDADADKNNTNNNS